ncbi:MAG: DUF962 domain-containing protein [Gammaproteobacteria bacterium]|nr:DUF962 domain-containing protein [Gammaproteobacteria bacterium]
MGARFGSFREFYPYYLGEHADRRCRRLHFIGTSLAVLQWLAALATREPWLLLSGLVTGYGFAWVGHFFFEKNRPATFTHPLYSLIGDFAMARDILAGRIRW